MKYYEHLKVNVLQCLTSYINRLKENSEIDNLKKILGVFQYAKVIGEKNIQNMVNR